MVLNLHNIHTIFNIEQNIAATADHYSIGAIERTNKELNAFLLTSNEYQHWPPFMRYFALLIAPQYIL